MVCIIPFGGVNGAEGMSWGCIYGIKLHLVSAGVYNIVPCPCGNDDGIVVGYTTPNVDIVSVAAHKNHALPLLDTDKLVGVVVNLCAYVLIGVKAHKGYLKVFSRPVSGAEIVVLLCYLFHIRHHGVRAVVVGASYCDTVGYFGVEIVVITHFFPPFE